MSYSFTLHKHNYAVWTAARAVQRSFTTTSKIKEAIEESSLQKFAESEEEITEKGFELFHRKCAGQIINNFNALDVKGASYGRAAKIISIYLKTAVILPNRASCTRSQIIHPPIDRILLKKLAKETKKRAFLDISWTSLDEEGYWLLVKNIKELPMAFNWRLEEFWRPESDN